MTELELYACNVKGQNPSHPGFFVAQATFRFDLLTFLSRVFLQKCVVIILFLAVCSGQFSSVEALINPLTEIIRAKSLSFSIGAIPRQNMKI